MKIQILYALDFLLVNNETKKNQIKCEINCNDSNVWVKLLMFFFPTLIHSPPPPLSRTYMLHHIQPWDENINIGNGHFHFWHMEHMSKHMNDCPMQSINVDSIQNLVLLYWQMYLPHIVLPNQLVFSSSSRLHITTVPQHIYVLSVFFFFFYFAALTLSISFNRSYYSIERIFLQSSVFAFSVSDPSVIFHFFLVCYLVGKIVSFSFTW